MSQKITVVRSSTGSESVAQDNFTPFDTGERMIELSNSQTHVQPDGFRDIGDSLRIIGIRIKVGNFAKAVDFEPTERYKFKPDTSSNGKVFKIEALMGDRLAITNLGCYPFHFQIDAVYNKENGKLLVMGRVLNNRTNLPITIDKVIISYKE